MVPWRWSRAPGCAVLLVAIVELMLVLEGSGLQSSDPLTIGPRNGLMAAVSRHGGRTRIYRKLEPPATTTSSPSPSTTPTPPSTSRSSLSNSPSSSSTASSTSTSSSSSSSSFAPTTPAPPKTTPDVIFYVSEIRELDSDGNDVTQKDNTNREFDGFDELDYNVTNQMAQPVVIPNSKLPALALTLEAVVPAPLSGNLSETVGVTMTNGTLTAGEETMDLVEGQLVVIVEVDQWQWCGGACPKQAAYLEVDFTIELAAGRTVKESTEDQSYGDPKKFSLGKDACAQFSTKTFVDGSWRNMTSGFPKLSSTRDSKYVITTRIPRFNTSATYNMAFDPGFTASDSPDKGGPVGHAPAILGDLKVIFGLLIIVLHLS